MTYQPDPIHLHQECQAEDGRREKQKESIVRFVDESALAMACTIERLTERLAEADAILSQLGYFDRDTAFMSLRLSYSEADVIGRAQATTEMAPEAFLTRLCALHLGREETKHSA